MTRRWFTVWLTTALVLCLFGIAVKGDGLWFLAAAVGCVAVAFLGDAALARDKRARRDVETVDRYTRARGALR